MENQALVILRDQAISIILGTVFLFIGLAVCGIAAMRRRSGERVLVWVGICCAMYGARPLVESLVLVGGVPHWFQAGVPYLETVIAYLIMVVAALAWLELSRGKLRYFLQAVILVGLAIGLAGIVFFIFTGSKYKLIPYENLLADCSLPVLVTVVAVPSLWRRYLVMPDRGVLLVGTLVFTTEALVVNLVRPLGFQSSFIWDSLGFAALLFAFGYVAVRIIFANERRLLSIENELAIAREIQNSILPSGVPEVNNLQISAAYLPMTAVAGDFYEFIRIDQNRVGFLVADVSGHGVPAALIAAMIKVAMQSAVSRADDPTEVLRGLNRSLSAQLRGQFVTAAYLWVDTEIHKASYSAAGHPPLLRWRRDKLEPIESNGLLFGVTPGSDYPVCDLSLEPGDRFLLYTDGVTEAENAAGVPFGDARLEQIVRNNQLRPPSDLSDQLLSEIRRWQPTPTTQQDDITLIVIDVL
jgi:sigma-B regulation protein RsbU (phosphoserine phosphatase)